MSNLIAFKKIKWQRVSLGARQKVVEVGTAKMRLLELTDKFVEDDWCVKGHIGYVLEGRMQIDFDGKVVVFEAGDGLFIPAGREHKHKGKVLTDVVRMILVEDIQSSYGEQ